MRVTAARVAAAAAALLVPLAASAQSSSAVPAVLFRFEPAYQSVLAASTAERRDPAEDARWAEEHARDLTEFYASDGGRLLRSLSDYAGLAWPYRDIPVYLVRTLPTLSIQYPLTLAVGEIDQGQSRQDVPAGDFLVLTFAHQIAHYLLDPPPRGLSAARPRALEHPLMEEGNYRREALVNLVTYRALTDLWGSERLERAIDEPLWASYNPEAAFVDTLQSRWSLSRSRPLLDWLAQQADDGPLVRLAERFESSGTAGGVADRGGAPRGATTMAGTEVGLDLGQTAGNRIFIAFLDPGSPAEAAGLLPADVVLTVEGRRPAGAAEALRMVREAWETNREVNLSVEREGKEVFFQIH
ncbi:MAG: hypothetical protein ABR599_07695 [Gemmatimonadota bacterium]